MQYSESSLDYIIQYDFQSATISTNIIILHCLNFVLLTGKYFIFLCKSQDTDIVFSAYCKTLVSLLETKKYVMYKNGKTKEFDETGSPLLLSL